MYDKSKKTWSQRLKITKTEKSFHAGSTNTTPPASPDIATNTTANNAHSHHSQMSPQPQYEAAAMQMQLQQLTDYHASNGGGMASGLGYDYMPSNLSRSMKYAEPWIYGTVRGIPARPYHHYHPQAPANYGHPHAAAIFASHPFMAAESLAVVICSCPEYLNGTKRDVKKASVCKKCKGSRLPLAHIGGTVRLPATNHPSMQAAKLRSSGAATMRVVSSTKKARPTILDPQKDPYDLMRRSRLLSPEPGGVNLGSGSSSNSASNTPKEKSRNNRGKSASPTRGRSRTRPQMPTKKPSTAASSTNGSDKPNAHELDDCWLVEDDDALLNDAGAHSPSTSTASSAARRSILRCNVNPYDLISIKSSQTLSSLPRGKPTTSQNEFSAPNDDFNVDDAALNEEAPPFAVTSINHASGARTMAATINQAPQMSKAPTPTHQVVAENSTVTMDACAKLDKLTNKLNYTNVQAIAGQRISLGEHKSGTKKSLIKQSEDGRCYESIIIATDDAALPKPKDINSKERQHQRRAADEQEAQRNAKTNNGTAAEMPSPNQQPKRPPRNKKQDSQHEPNESCSEVELTPEVETGPASSNTLTKDATADCITVLTVTNTQQIKSILKRPSPKMMDNAETSGKEQAKNSTTHAAAIGGNPKTTNDKQATPANQRRAINGSHAGNSELSSARAAGTPVANSQFYISLPQTRKKVQFRVEDNVVHHHSSDDSQSKSGGDGNDSDNDLGNDATTTEEASKSSPAAANYEYYNRKREQQRLLQKQQPSSPTPATATAAETDPAPEHVNNDSTIPTTNTNSLLTPKALFTKSQNNADSNASAIQITLSATVDKDISSSSRRNNDEERSDAPTAKSYDDTTAPGGRQRPQHLALGNANNAGIESLENCTQSLPDQCHDASPPPTPSSAPPSSSSSVTGAITLTAATASQKDDVGQVTPLVDVGGAGDYDGAAKQQQQQRKLQALAASDISDHTAQSRNPIRRSQSERHQPSYKKLTNFGVGDGPKDHISGGSGSADNQNSNSGSQTSKRRNGNGGNAILNFKDTMALRIKSSRNDTRDLFARPREPPPPPPAPATTAPSSSAAGTVSPAPLPSSTTKESTNATKFKANTLSLSPTGQTPHQRINDADKDKDVLANASAGAGADPPTSSATTVAPKPPEATKVAANGLGSQQQQRRTNANNQRNLVNNSASSSRQEINRVNFADNRNAQQMTLQNIHESRQQQQQDAKQQQEQQGRNLSRHTAIRALTKAPMADATAATAIPLSPSSANAKQQPQQPQQPQQRTVVRVAPFNKTTSEVHRLKISHTDDAAPCQSPTTAYGLFHYNGSGTACASSPSSGGSPGYRYGYNYSSADYCVQKKTSILINGDDCYSTMNLSCDASTPLFQSSVVVADYSSSANSNSKDGSDSNAASSNSNDNCLMGAAYEGLKVTTTSNTVTINVSSPRSAQEELIYQHNKINTLLSQQQQPRLPRNSGTGRAIIPIKATSEVHLQRSASSTSSTSTSSMTSTSSSCSGGGGSVDVGGGESGCSSGSIMKRGRTLIRLDYEQEKQQQQPSQPTTPAEATPMALLSHEEELLKILRNPVEAVKRNLVPHVCGRHEGASESDNIRNKKMKDTLPKLSQSPGRTAPEPLEPAQEKPQTERNSFISKLLEDPTLSQVADGLETDTIAELIENSLKRLQESRNAIDISGTKDSDDMNRLINLSLQKIKEERQPSTTTAPSTHLTIPNTKDEDRISNRGSISSANSFASANNYEMFDFDANESDCYQSCSSEITSPGDDDASSAATRSRFYQMLVDATLAEIEMSTSMEEEDVDEHHYESIKHNGDPIYEEITDVPPPLPLSAPPLNDAELEKKAARSIFEGASKYDILSYLVDAKERGVVREEPFDYPINCSNPIIIEEEACDTLSDLSKRKHKNNNARLSVHSDTSEDNQSSMSSLSPPPNTFMCGSTLLQRKTASSSEIERNDSGVGSETSKSSRSKYQNPLSTCTNQLPKNSPLHLCEDCDGPVETQVTESGVMFAPLVCRKCGKKRVERKEIITEIVETEEKYGRDLQIILEEFCHPMLVAGLLTQEQLSAIFLNTEELLENNQTLAERMRDALDIALEQGDDDLLTVNIGRIFLDFTQMLHAFESYCVRQAGASLLLANLEKEKELLRIFLKVSQMENAVLRRMNLNSFLMVPVQRVTKYPLLLARLYKVTPAHLEGRDQLKQAQEKIELHLNHINQEAKDVPTKLWRRISSSSPNRRASCEIDMINIKLRKMAIDILEWNHDEVRFAMEGKLLYTQPTDSNWKKARTIKLTPVNALLVTNGKPSANYKAEKVMSDKLNFPKHTGIREASLLVVKEKCGRYTLIREPLYLDRCVVCSEADWDDYFEVQEISSKDTFIFKAEDGVRTKQWYTQLQYHAQGMGSWRKRRNALANIMINGMLARS